MILYDFKYIVVSWGGLHPPRPSQLVGLRPPWTDGRMDGQTVRQTDGRTVGQTDGRTDGWFNGWTARVA